MTDLRTIDGGGNSAQVHVKRVCGGWEVQHESRSGDSFGNFGFFDVGDRERAIHSALIEVTGLNQECPRIRTILGHVDDWHTLAPFAALAVRGSAS